MVDVVVIAVSVLFLFSCVTLLRWLYIEQPPYDWQADADLYRAQKERELEEYKRELQRKNNIPIRPVPSSPITVRKGF